MGGAGRAVIVGAGQAGGTAARALREFGWRGPVVLVGSEPHLPYERPPLSKEVLLGEAPPEAGELAPVSVYDEAAIELRRDVAAVGLELAAARLHLADGSRLDYDLLLLATGARPRRLAHLGASARLRTLRSREDALAIRAALVPGAHVAVIGAGMIGLEVAAAARARGCRVMVMEAAALPLGRVFPVEIGEAVAALHRAQGVELRLGQQAVGFEEEAGQAALCCADGERIAVDLVVVGVGIEPDTRLAAAAGLACDDGLLVDGFCRTSAPNVLAAGDVARLRLPEAGIDERHETWQNAQDQALAAARTACGEALPYRPLPQAWTRQYGLLLQLAGDPRQGERRVMRGEEERGGSLAFHFAGDRLVAALAWDRPRDFAVARRLVGRSGLDERDVVDESRPLKRLLSAA